MKLSKTRTRIIETYERLSEVKKVRPSYRTVARVAKVAIGTVQRTILAYNQEKGSE